MRHLKILGFGLAFLLVLGSLAGLFAGLLYLLALLFKDYALLSTLGLMALVLVYVFGEVVEDWLK